MAFYLTRRTCAVFINICREIWEPQLLGSVKANLRDSSPARCCRGWCFSNMCRAVLFRKWLCCWKHCCPRCLAQHTTCFRSAAGVCTFSTRLHCTGWLPCAFSRFPFPRSTGGGGHMDLAQMFDFAWPFLASDVALSYAVSRREAPHASLPLLQEELPCYGRLRRTTLVWPLCVILQTTPRWLKRWQRHRTETLPWKPGVTLRWRSVVFAHSEGLGHTCFSSPFLKTPTPL